MFCLISNLERLVRLAGCLFTTRRFHVSYDIAFALKFRHSKDAYKLHVSSYLNKWVLRSGAQDHSRYECHKKRHACTNICKQMHTLKLSLLIHYHSENISDRRKCLRRRVKCWSERITQRKRFGLSRAVTYELRSANLFVWERASAIASAFPGLIWHFKSAQKD